MMGRLRRVFVELRRRRVFRVAGLYIVGAWALLQVAALAFQSLEIPDRALQWVWLAAAAGFPIALVFGWRYDITPDGIRRTAPRQTESEIDLSLRLPDFVILGALLAIAVAVSVRLGFEIGGVETIDQTMADVSPYSLAVLPLENLSGDPEQEYFVQGMHESLIADLARISGLKVISRTSTLQYLGTSKPAPQIAAELGVMHLLSGSAQRAGDRVRVNVQLVDATRDENVWTESFDRESLDVLRLQTDIARAVASQVRVTISPNEDASLEAGADIDPEAYELYLRGRFHWYQFTDADLNLALEYFQRAIDKDPDYALAYVGFADALATPAHMGMVPTHQVFPAATGYVDRALELDPDLAEAHDLRARIHFAYDWDWDAAERGFRRAISLKPGYPDVHIVYSQFLGITNRWDESLDEARIGLELDPLNPWFRLAYATRLEWFGRDEEAREQILDVLADQPGLFEGWETLWEIEHRLGNDAAAIDAALRYFETLGEHHVATVIEDERGTLDYLALTRRIAETLETQSTRPYMNNVAKAVAWIKAGDTERALGYLEDAYAAHESDLVYTIVRPIFAPARSDDRYLALLRKMNFRS